MDSSLEVMERYREFEIRVIQETRGIKLELKNAPQSAFVDGKLMYSIRDHLFSVLRDIVYIVKEQESRGLGAESQSPAILISSIIFCAMRELLKAFPN